MDLRRYIDALTKNLSARGGGRGRIRSSWNSLVGSAMHFPGSHILSIGQFERTDVDQVFAVADAMRPYAHREKVTRGARWRHLGVHVL